MRSHVEGSTNNVKAYWQHMLKYYFITIQSLLDKSTFKTRTVMALGVIFITSLLSYFFVLNKQLLYLNKYAHEELALKQQYRQQFQYYIKQQQHNITAKLYQQQWHKFTRQNNQANMVKKLIQVSKLAEIEVKNISWQQKQQQDFYAYRTIDMQAQGNYQQIANFFYYMDTITKFIVLDNFTLAPLKQIIPTFRRNETPQLVLKVQLKSYYYPNNGLNIDDKIK